jgi:hypothetical protein
MTYFLLTTELKLLIRVACIALFYHRVPTARWVLQGPDVKFDGTPTVTKY